MSAPETGSRYETGVGGVRWDPRADLAVPYIGVPHATVGLFRGFFV